MASVRAKNNRIAARLWAYGKEWSTTVDLQPTKANLRSTAKHATELERRLKLGEPWELLRSELRGETSLTKAPQTLDYYMQHVLDTSSVKESTLINYENTYQRVWAVFGKRNVRTLFKSELQKRIAEFDYTPETIRSALSVLRLALEVANDDGVLERLPTDNWKVGSRQKRRKVLYTEKQVHRLLAQLKEQNQTAWRFFSLGFFSGMRTEELLALQKRHLLPSHRILVDQVRTANKIVPSTKTNKIREVQIPIWVWKEVVERYRFSGWLFVGDKGSPFTTGNRLLREFAKAHKHTGIARPLNVIGKPMPYPWRGTYVSLALQNGMDPAKVAHQIGDDIQTMFDHYAEFIPRDDDDHIVEKVFGRRYQETVPEIEVAGES